MVLTENRPKIVKNSLKNGRKNQRPKLNGVEKGRSEVEKVDGPILRWNEMKLDGRNNKKGRYLMKVYGPLKVSTFNLI